LFGKIPEKDESVRWENLLFVIADVDGNKINTVRVERSGSAE
jgi:CBS domain containing-hemolysin-like protein